MKFDFRSESFERKSTSIIFVNKLIIGCSKKKEEIVLKRLLNRERKKPGLKFNPGLALIGL